MTKEMIAEIEKKLTEERDRLLQDMSKAITGLHQIQDKEELADFTDQSSIESDRHFQLRMKERDRNLLLKIESTLEKIKEGTFGICEECGKPIGDKRILARPVVSLCIDCKTEQERNERYS